MLGALLAGPLVGTACGSDAAKGTVAAPPKARVSKIYEIPLHESAVALPGESGPGGEAYRVALPVDGLANYYTSVGGRMDFRDLQWCNASRKETAARGFERTWRKPSTNDFLVLKGVPDGTGSRLFILDDKENGTRLC